MLFTFALPFTHLLSYAQCILCLAIPLAPLVIMIYTFSILWENLRKDECKLSNIDEKNKNWSTFSSMLCSETDNQPRHKRLN